MSQNKVADLSVPVGSKQYVRVPVEDITGADPTSDVVEMSFPRIGVDPTTFVTGSWMTISGVHYARCMIGPGTSAILTVGYYDVYVKVSDNPEVPVLYAGTLEVF